MAICMEKKKELLRDQKKALQKMSITHHTGSGLLTHKGVLQYLCQLASSKR